LVDQLAAHDANVGFAEIDFSHRTRSECPLATFAGERYYNPSTNPTVKEVVDHWLENKRGTVKPQTIRGHLPLLRNIVGPLLQGTPTECVHYALTGEKPHRNSKLLLMLGGYKVSELSTAQLRRWHSLIRTKVGAHTANRVMSMLKGILALAEEGFGVRVSEQLGLLWHDIDLELNIISICRVQERDGTNTETTKTEAGKREIPISSTLRTMLLKWWLRYPRSNGETGRVFPGPGVQRQWPLPRIGGGGPILYSNFLKRYWKPAFAASGIRYVTHHSARHSFVSVLQAQGVEVGLVARLAGHSNPAVTLGHCTQAVRGGAEAVAMLERAHQGE